MLLLSGLSGMEMISSTGFLLDMIPWLLQISEQAKEFPSCDLAVVGNSCTDQARSLAKDISEFAEHWLRASTGGGGAGEASIAPQGTQVREPTSTARKRRAEGRRRVRDFRARKRLKLDTAGECPEAPAGASASRATQLVPRGSSHRLTRPHGASSSS